MRFAPVGFESLLGFGEDDHLAAFRCFAGSARALAAGKAEVRPARSASLALLAAGRAALQARVADGAQARRFFEAWFRPFRVIAEPPGEGLLTGYYEPCVGASRRQTATYRWPLLRRPDDLVTFAPGAAPADFPAGVTGARRRDDGRFEPYPDREAIEKERRGPIVWLRDAAEAFLIQVQGSAQVRFPDGGRARLVYDGRNGLPCASIGRILIESGEIDERDMSLERLKGWLRAAGLNEGERGLELMRRNRSFVFFRLVEDFDPALGPIGGEGVALTPVRSIAVDRAVWSYGLPFFIEAEAPWAGEKKPPFRRLMIAQDTGAAIVGGARADIFFDSGGAAGRLAGSIRHRGAFTVLLPLGDES
ncbi:MAG: MltA domain-containing protein [Hyphomicrobiales bacterium]|nr:MltA domain-containing protein [Hyphomicrobiales bacterium]